MCAKQENRSKLFFGFTWTCLFVFAEVIYTKGLAQVIVTQGKKYREWASKNVFMNSFFS